MISFWMLFSFLSAFWLTAVINLTSVNDSVLLLSAAFYLLYFLMPILSNTVRSLIYISLPVLIMAAFSTISSNPVVWFILFVVAIEVTIRLSIRASSIYLAYITLLSLVPGALSGEFSQVLSQFLICVFLSVITLTLRLFSIKRMRLQKEYDQIYSDHRHLKRQVVRGEQLARQEERSAVARDIHDSVGHRLTALVMQLEVARYKTQDDNEKQQLTDFKDLAQRSLHETRAAVSALKSDETAGLQAIIQLVRKLESESHIKIRFLLESGVLNEPLSNKQSIVIYRAIQESLTNMMRHSHTREADIHFKLLADRYVQFSVSHPIKEKVELVEGFGLSNMRNRLEEIDGKLTISQHNFIFKVTGQFPVETEDGNEELG